MIGTIDKKYPAAPFSGMDQPKNFSRIQKGFPAAGHNDRIPGSLSLMSYINNTQPLADVKIRPLYLSNTEANTFPRISQETTSPIPTVSIRKGIGSATPYA